MEEKIMNEVEAEVNTAPEVEEEETMAASYAAFNKDFTVIRRGERLTGTIIKVTDSEVMVDIGGKSEGVIPRSEFTPAEAEHLTEIFHEGDEVEVIVVRKENEDGHPILSKGKWMLILLLGIKWPKQWKMAK